MTDYVEDLSDQEWLKNAVDGSLDDVTLDGKVYGIPVSVEGYGLVYNKEIFKDAGIDASTLTKMGADEEWTLCDKKEVLELDISYPIEKIHAQTFGIKISTGKNRQFEIVFCKEKQCCFVDRTTAGVNPHDKFAGKYKAPVDFTQEFLTIKLLMDVSQSELFINNGEVVMSNLLFPEDFYKVKLFATGGDLVIEKSIIYEMDEIMNHPLDGDLI